MGLGGSAKEGHRKFSARVSFLSHRAMRSAKRFLASSSRHTNAHGAAAAQAVLESHALERIIVGIHYGQGTATQVSNALRRAGYSILLEAASVPAQPDGVVIAVAPRVEAPLSLLALAGRSHKSAKDAEPPTPG